MKSLVRLQARPTLSTLDRSGEPELDQARLHNIFNEAPTSNYTEHYRALGVRQRCSEQVLRQLIIEQEAITLDLRRL
jgi:hypothetical protein